MMSEGCVDRAIAGEVGKRLWWIAGRHVWWVSAGEGRLMEKGVGDNRKQLQ